MKFALSILSANLLPTQYDSEPSHTPNISSVNSGPDSPVVPPSSIPLLVNLGRPINAGSCPSNSSGL